MRVIGFFSPPFCIQRPGVETLGDRLRRIEIGPSSGANENTLAHVTVRNWATKVNIG